MKHFRLSLLAVLSLLGGAASLQAVEVKLPFIQEEGFKILRSYQPQRAATSSGPTRELRVFQGLVNPQYGEIHLGAAGAERIHAFVIDNPASVETRLFFDTNANGNLTDDPPATWTCRQIKSQKDGKDYWNSTGTITADLIFDGQVQQAKINVYTFDPKDESRPKDALFYYSDYARSGSVELDGKSYKSLLVDVKCKGDFANSFAKLRMDINGDGAFDYKTEAFGADEPFNIEGVTYEIKGLSASGASFEIVKSDKTVASSGSSPMSPSAPNSPSTTSSVSSVAPDFEVETLSGRFVSLTKSYRGKIVLLDFWATWCGPCVAEVPNVVKAYEKHRSSGLEILGISLDEEHSIPSVEKFTAQHKMPWFQVCDGKAWKTDLVQLYKVKGIPATFLIDGDTGMILKTNLRGDALESAIAEALANKKSGRR